MAPILKTLGFKLFVLAAVFIVGSRWFFPPDSTEAWWCSIIGLLSLAGGVISLNITGNNQIHEAFSELATKSDAILADPLYADALKIVNAHSEGKLEHSDDSIQDGVDYLVQNGIDQQEARKNLKIVLGSLIVDRSELHT